MRSIESIMYANVVASMSISMIIQVEQMETEFQCAPRGVTLKTIKKRRPEYWNRNENRKKEKKKRKRFEALKEVK